MLDLLEEKLLLTPMEVGELMVVELFQEKIQAKLIEVQPMHADGLLNH
jgi:hypothetical protein